MTEARKRILDYLIKEAQSVGVVVVRDAANQFLRLGLKATVTANIRRAIPRSWTIKAFTIQNGKCKRCGKDMTLADATSDHVIAVTQGGEHHQRNIVAMHRACNSSKNDNDLVTEAKQSGHLMNQMFNEGEQ
jgi:5-methylcytosine-specific restriction endonuclease McrA